MKTTAAIIAAAAIIALPSCRYSGCTFVSLDAQGDIRDIETTVGVEAYQQADKPVKVTTDATIPAGVLP
jgi:hypothetical protein